MFDKSSADLGGVPDYTRTSPQKLLAREIPWSTAHVRHMHMKAEANVKGVAERLEKCDGGEVLAKAVGVTTTKGELFRWSTIARAWEVMGFPDFAPRAAPAVFSGMGAATEMQVRRVYRRARTP